MVQKVKDSEFNWKDGARVSHHVTIITYSENTYTVYNYIVQHTCNFFFLHSFSGRGQYYLKELCATKHSLAYNGSKFVL